MRNLSGWGIPWCVLSWRKFHVNSVIRKTPGSDREAVATPGINGATLKLQGGSTYRPDHLGNDPPECGGHPRDVAAVCRTRFGVLVPRAPVPKVAARASPDPGLLCVTPSHWHVRWKVRFVQSPISSLLLCRLPRRAKARAAYQMIIHHAHGLHKGVADGGAHEGEVLLLQRFAQAVAHLGFGGHLG